MKFKSDRQRKAVMCKLNQNKPNISIPRKYRINKPKLTQSQKDRYRRIKNNSDGNPITVRELEIHTQNTPKIWRQHLIPTFKKMDKRKDKGIFSYEGLVLSMRSVADKTVKSYEREYGSSGANVKDRNALAIKYANEYVKGMYDKLYK